LGNLVIFILANSWFRMLLGFRFSMIVVRHESTVRL
jgi:hypothetical protein